MASGDFAIARDFPCKPEISGSPSANPMANEGDLSLLLSYSSSMDSSGKIRRPHRS